MSKKVIAKPNCPKCNKPMSLVSTGSKVRTFHCDNCKETKIVDREDKRK
jgi:tRNA(Ile2) C34 agmatinyltransferase TiaS